MGAMWVLVSANRQVPLMLTSIKWDRMTVLKVSDMGTEDNDVQVDTEADVDKFAGFPLDIF
jgi:hypothetical protein